MQSRKEDGEDFDPRLHRADKDFWFKIVGSLLSLFIAGLVWWMSIVWADTQDSKNKIFVLSEKVIQIKESQEEIKVSQRDMGRKVDQILMAVKS